MEKEREGMREEGREARGGEGEGKGVERRRGVREGDKETSGGCIASRIQILTVWSHTVLAILSLRKRA